MDPNAAYLAADPDTPPAQLFALAGRFPAAFCANPLLPLLPLEFPDLPERLGSVTLGSLLRYSSMPADLLAFLAGYPTPSVAQLARQHIAFAGEAGDEWMRHLVPALRPFAPTTPDELLLDLVFLGAVPTWLREALDEAVIALATTAPSPTRLHYALPDGFTLANPFTVADLRHLAEHELPAVRAFAASHPLADSALLEGIATREDWVETDFHVYAAVAENPRTPPATLARFAAEQTWVSTGRRLRVAHNLATPPHVLGTLLDDLTADVRRAALRHPNLSAELREQVRLAFLSTAALSSDPFVRAIALAQSGDEETLSEGALSFSWVERLAVALNPRRPPAALRDDGHRLVRAAAQGAAHNS